MARQPLCSERSVVRVHNPLTGDWDVQRDAAGNVVSKPCQKHAMVGFDVCWIHAGGKERTKRYVTKHSPQIGNLLGEMDLPDMNPMDGLLEAVRYSGAMMRSMGVLVAELTEKPEIQRDDFGEPVFHEPGIWGLDSKGEQAPHVLMKLYDIWMERYARSCKMALDAGIDERIVRNAEMTSSSMLLAFQSALKQVALTQEQRDALSKAMADQVRTIISGEGPRRALPGQEGVIDI